MTVFEREEINKDGSLKLLMAMIKDNHQVPAHTSEELNRNRQNKDFCVEARHFAELGTKPSIYLHYDSSSWYREGGKVAVKFDRIAIYDNCQEYESSRLKSLSTGKGSTINFK